MKDRIDEVACALYLKGFIQTALAGDGASENRVIMHRKAALSVGHLIDIGLFPDEWKKKFPSLLDFKIAYWHPDLVLDETMIFIHANMPHWVKKFVNALERLGEKKHKIDLWFRGTQMSLDILHDIWEMSRTPTGLRLSKCTEDHFEKNAYSRMRFFLAVQVTSESMCQLIEHFAEDCGGFAKYQPL